MRKSRDLNNDQHEGEGLLRRLVSLWDRQADRSTDKSQKNKGKPKKAPNGSLLSLFRLTDMPYWPAFSACIAFYIMTAVYAAALGGYMQPIAERVGQVVSFMGLSVKQVDITGIENEGRRADVRKALGVSIGDPILWFNAHSARERVQQLTWVKSVTVQRLLPDALRVFIEPRQAFAIWQRDGKFAIVDDEGIVISETLEDRFASLPLIVGYGANKTSKDLIAALRSHEALNSRVKALVRVADRRWNIRLINGVDIKLPEENYQQVLEEIAALDESYGLLARDIESVDFRVKDRISIRLGEDAAERRNVSLNGGTAKPTKRSGEDT